MSSTRTRGLLSNLKDKTLVIIGGTTGLGLSAARAFAAAAAQIIIVGRNAESAREAERQIGPSCRALVGDATEPDAARAAIQSALSQFGGFHGLYHVAGGSGRKRGDGPLHEMTDEGWDYTIQQNLSSVFYSNRAATQQFMAQGKGGSILNLSSILGLSPSREFFSTHAYAAAKAAIIGLTRSSAAYYAPHNIRFNVLAPSLIETPMARRAVGDERIMEFIRTKQPLDGGRIGQPDDLDGAAVFFMSDSSRFITGQVLAVDGGWAVSDGQYATGSHDAA